MLGKHVKEDETSEQACVREFIEEAEYEIRVVETRDIVYCDVCATVFGRRVRNDCEIESCLFDTVPEQLSFDREEYEDTVPWARKAVRKSLGGSGDGRISNKIL